MIVYEKAHLKVAEFLFDEPEAKTAADIVRYQFRPEPIEGCCSSDYHTLWFDLSASCDALLRDMNKETRYEIRRSEREGFLYEFNAHPNVEWADQFIEFFNRFADGKHLVHANRARILGFLNHGALDLSRMRAASGDVLVWHAYIRTPKCARLLHSASLFRHVDKQTATAISLANRRQHWLDMQRFRDEGLRIYDFGGWYVGEADTEKLRINRFKQSFGGEVVHHYNADRPATWKGSAALLVRDTIQALRGRNC
jgi:hypothetical protein